MGAALGEVRLERGCRRSRPSAPYVGADQVEDVGDVFVVEPLAVVGQSAGEHVGLADVVVLGLHAEGDDLDRQFAATCPASSLMQLLARSDWLEARTSAPRRSVEGLGGLDDVTRERARRTGTGGRCRAAADLK